MKPPPETTSHQNTALRKSRCLFPVLIFLTLCGLFEATPAHAEIRKWQDASGRFSVDAVFVKRTSLGVVLRKSNGTVIEVPYTKLSREDLDYVSTLDPIPIEPGDQESKAPETTGEMVDTMLRTTLENLDESGANGKTTVRRLKRLSSIIPESFKVKGAAPGLLIISAILFPIAYIWILIREFGIHPGWGIAQILADFLAACLTPFLGLLVMAIFTLKNFRVAWKPFLLNLLATAFAVTSLMYLPRDIYEGLGVFEEKSAEEEAAPENESRSYRPGKYR